jgi:acyl-CoA synthetase (AMP-forming)/AMP-acid ligase II
MPNFVEVLLSPEHDAATALVFRGESVTYRDLRSRVQRYAAALTESGMVSGDCIGILGDNSIFYVQAYLAAIYAGGVAVPLPPTADAARLHIQLNTSQAKFGFVEGKYGARLREAAAGTSLERVWLDGGPPQPGWLGAADLVAHDPAAHPAATPRSLDDLAVINFTSGSTGTPLGVMVSHRNLEANTRSIIEYLRLTGRDRALLVLPVSYCFGASVLHTHLAAGGATVMASSFAYPEKVLDELTAYACSGFYGVPSTYQILLRRSTFTTRRFPDLRYMAQAGGRLAPVFVDEIRKALPEVDFYVMYGQTEATARLSYLEPAMLPAKSGSIGRAIPGVTLRVLRPDGQPAAPGELCEIVAGGDNITQGYLHDPEATAAHFRDGHLWTGDLAVTDDDGFIFIRDRQRDFIKVGGQRVGSKEVEDVIAELPDVVEVAVVGVPHETLGEAIAAFVVARPRSGLTADQVVRHCRSRLGGDREPKIVEFRPELQKNESGKIMKAAVKKAALGL